MAAESGLADAVRAINNLATAQVRKDTPSLTDVKGIGRPKEFIGREEDFQQLKAQVAARAKIAAAVQARLLTTAQVRKDTPSFIDVKGLARPKEFSGKEEDFPQWSKKTEAFSAGV